MIISDKVLLCIMLAVIGTKSTRTVNQFGSQYDHNHQIDFPQLETPHQDNTNIRNGLLLPPVIDTTMTPWTYEEITSSSPPLQTTNRFLPRSPLRKNRNSSSTILQSSHKSKWKMNLQDDVTIPYVKKELNIIENKFQILDHITQLLQTCFLRAIMQDLIAKMSAIMQQNNLMLGPNEMEIINNQCSRCTLAEMQSFLTVLLTILEKYPDFISDNVLSNHVATEYERAADYINHKMQKFRSEINQLNSESDLTNLKKRYARRERNGGIMSILLEWYESYGRFGQDNIDYIQDKLIKHVTNQKRYWLISIRGVL